MLSNLLLIISVTPYAGVWIETALQVINALQQGNVTPYAGVWIETAGGTATLEPGIVTPYAGVWIETSPRRY